MQMISGFLRMAGSGEYRPLVVLQDFEPGCHIGSMILACLRRDAKVGAQEGGTDFGHKFFHGITGIGKTLAA